MVVALQYPARPKMIRIKLRSVSENNLRPSLAIPVSIVLDRDQYLGPRAQPLFSSANRYPGTLVVLGAQYG